ncbi:MAG: methionyl-tRNA formyltransferase [Lentisphaeria bacterium]|nr:methionyl-tRNA formyltransferase [Lentisphaeria bacterium]
MTKPIKTVFLGSGPIAIPVLRALAASPDIELSAVISQLDRPAGRKRIMTPTPLTAAALALGLDVIRTADVNTPEFTGFLNSLAPDLLCVISFGQILKQGVLSVPEICCVNIHASLLPRYRGASPVTQAILHRENSTGVCFMQMERGLDSGPVFRQLAMPLTGVEYADSLEDALGELAAGYAVETLIDIAAGKLTAKPQNPAQITVCRKISKRDGQINWQMEAKDIEAMTRAYYPWPGASARFRTANGRESTVCICKAKALSGSPLIPGEVTGTPGKLVIGCGRQSALEILELIPAGGKRMTAAAFRNGMRGELPSVIMDEEI